MPPRPRSATTPAELRRLVQAFVRDFGLLSQDATPCEKPLATSHAHALMILVDETRSLSQKELVEALGLDKSNVTRLCQRMEAEGQIEQVRGEQDARVRLLKLTSRGTKLAREIEQSSEDRFASLLKVVSPSERARMFEGLELLSRAVRTLMSETDDQD
jgi:DNA-binding MarR family transcriptional regulator